MVILESTTLTTSIQKQKSFAKLLQDKLKCQLAVTQHVLELMILHQHYLIGIFFFLLLGSVLKQIVIEYQG